MPYLGSSRTLRSMRTCRILTSREMGTLILSRKTSIGTCSTWLLSNHHISNNSNQKREVSYQHLVSLSPRQQYSSPAKPQCDPRVENVQAPTIRCKGIPFPSSIWDRHTVAKGMDSSRNHPLQANKQTSSSNSFSTNRSLCIKTPSASPLNSYPSISNNSKDKKSSNTTANRGTEITNITLEGHPRVVRPHRLRLRGKTCW